MGIENIRDSLGSMWYLVGWERWKFLYENVFFVFFRIVLNIVIYGIRDGGSFRCVFFV